MNEVQFKFAPRFYRRFKNRFEKYTFDVGILQNDIHYPAKGPKDSFPGVDKTDLKSPMRSIAGGPARQPDKSSRVQNLPTLKEVFVDVQQKTRNDLLRDPLRMTGNKDLIKMLDAFFAFVAGTSKPVRRLENALQALIRNPIVRGEYGNNSPATEKVKGFNRLFIDTGQMFNALKARVVRGKGKGK